MKAECEEKPTVWLIESAKQSYYWTEMCEARAKLFMGRPDYKVTPLYGIKKLIGSASAETKP